MPLMLMCMQCFCPIYIYMHMHIFIKILLQLDPWLGTLCVNLLTLLPQSWSDGYTYIFIHDMWQFILIWLLGFLICLLANYACTPYVYVIQFSVIVYSVHIIIHPYAYWCSTLMWKEGGISINLSVYIHNVYFNMLKFLTNSPFTSCYRHICAIEPLFTSWNNAIINACFAYDYSDPLNIITCFSQCAIRREILLLQAWYIYIYIVDIWINSCLNLWFIYILTCWYSYMPYCYVSICASVLLHCSRSWLDISIYICQVYCHGSTVISPLSCSLPCYFWSHNLYGQRSLFPCLLSHIRI